MLISFIINLAYLVIVYFVLVFIVSHFIVPNLAIKRPLPEKIPGSMGQAISVMKSKSVTPNEFLENAYELLGNKYKTGRLSTFLKFWYLFKGVDEIWNITGFVPCTQSNFILRIFLVQSGFFKDGDIALRRVFFNFSIHQYLQIKLEDHWIDVDVGEKQRGMSLGTSKKLFGV
jgi:hypothetical protein